MSEKLKKDEIMLRIFFSIIAFCTLLSANQNTKLENAQVSNKEIKNFANASVKLNTLKVSIQNKMDKKYKKTEQPLSSKEVESYNQEFMNKAKVVIQDNNLTIQKYNSLSQLFKNDNNFKARVQSLLLKK